MCEEETTGSDAAQGCGPVCGPWTASRTLARPRSALPARTTWQSWPPEAGAPGHEPWLRAERRADVKTTSSSGCATHRAPDPGPAAASAPAPARPALHQPLPACHTPRLWLFPRSPHGSLPGPLLSCPQQSRRSPRGCCPLAPPPAPNARADPLRTLLPGTGAARPPARPAHFRAGISGAGGALPSASRTSSRLGPRVSSRMSE